MQLNVKGELLDLNRPRVMAILNVTADSFYDGGQYLDVDKAVERAAAMWEEGADLIDVGAMSTRPGAEELPLELERQRVVATVRALIRQLPEVRISVDTYRSQIARAAVDEGAALINDVSGGQLDPDMLSAVAELRVPYIGMHMRGTPRNMAGLTDYDDLVRELIWYFSKMKSETAALGIVDLVIDPGFGFAKTREQNFELLSRLELLHSLELPMLVGLSRKSFIYKTLDTDSAGALNGTTALHTLALQKGARILRVHDVKEAVETVRLMESVWKASGELHSVGSRFGAPVNERDSVQ